MYNLVYKNKNGKILETIVQNKPYPLCNSVKQKCLSTNNYRLGLLKIVKCS